MKPVRLVIFLYLLLSVTAAFPMADFKMEKDLTVPAGETYPHSIVSVKGTLDIRGDVKQSVFLVGGTLHLDGSVAEDVICIASRVTVGKNARIERDLYVIGGSLQRDEDAKVEGEFFFFKFDLKKIENTFIPILADTRTVSFLKAVRILIWFIIALVVFVAAPHRVNAAEEIFEKNPRKIGAVGLLSFFALIFLLFISIILSFVIIGIPMLLVLILLYLAVYIFGRTVMFYTIGIKISQALKIKHMAPALFIVMGVVCYALLKFLPYVGTVVLILLNIFELGIGVGYFLRKRLRLQAEEVPVDIVD